MLRPVAALLALLVLVPTGTATAQTFPGSDVPMGSAPEPAPAEQSPAKARATPAAPAGPAAKTLFGAATDAAPLAARAIGFYSRGCLAGAKPLAIDGPHWQAMRLSRNRYWGHPNLIALIERFAKDAKELDGWPGLLVGDMSQPRGGPMLTGHESHQTGLDVDIWLSAMPDRRLTEKERDEVSAISMLAPDQLSVAPQIWSEWHVRLIKRAASYKEVERVLVHPAIKKALCQATEGEKNRTAWLAKVRPYWGHHYHMHIRIECPKDSPDCRPQPPPANDDGCGKELADWFELLRRPPDPKAKPAPPKPPLTMADLPQECRAVLSAGSKAKAPAVTAQPR